MRRRLTVIVTVCVALIAFASVAQATIISGTWSVSVTAWGCLACVPPLPVPANASATISFDNGVNYPNTLVPATNYSTNFGATAAAFNYSPASDQLEFIFANLQQGFVFFSFFNAASSASPTATRVRWEPLPSVDASSFTGTFTPAPEPSTLLLLLLGLGGLGLIRHRNVG